MADPKAPIKGREPTVQDLFELIKKIKPDIVPSGAGSSADVEGQKRWSRIGCYDCGATNQYSEDDSCFLCHKCGAFNGV